MHVLLLNATAYTITFLNAQNNVCCEADERWRLLCKQRKIIKYKQIKKNVVGKVVQATINKIYRVRWALGTK